MAAAAPLSPRQGGSLIACGAGEVVIDLKVDPPHVPSPGKMTGGDAGIAAVIAGINGRAGAAGPLSLTFGANFRAHHIRCLAEGIKRSPEAGPVLLDLVLRDSEALSWDAAGRAPQWKALAGNTWVTLRKVDVSGCSLEDAPSPNVYLGAIADGMPALEDVGFRHLGAWLEGGDDERFEFEDCVVGVLQKPSLRAVDLTHNNIGRYGSVLSALKTPKGGAGYGRMERLFLSWNGLGEHVDLLQHYANLTVLRFGKNPMDADAVEQLCDLYLLSPKHVARLAELELNDNDLGTAGGRRVLAALATHPALPLCRLGLHGNSLGDAPLAELSSPAFAALAALDVSGNDVTAAGVSHLVAARKGAFLPALTDLNLSDNDIGMSQSVLDLAALLPRGARLSLFEAVPKPLKAAVASFMGAGPGGADRPVVVQGVLYDSVAAAGLETAVVPETAAGPGLDAAGGEAVKQNGQRQKSEKAVLNAPKKLRQVDGEYLITSGTTNAVVDLLRDASQKEGAPLRLVAFADDSPHGGGIARLMDIFSKIGAPSKLFTSCDEAGRVALHGTFPLQTLVREASEESLPDYNPSRSNNSL